ncbi:MAG: tyrosine protein phosphatase yvh1 [Chaenotheca gracillima]|nr:MAG: tyrosine protein phosphatase yvh1 [Chaenotheca gracillima]
MVKFYESTFSYDYSFSAVSLAYFLRYPNPYSKHVLSTDVIDRYVDPVTHRLHTVRLHLKRSKIPAPVLRLLPRGVLGASNSNSGQSLVLEKSVVDAKEGWMETENKNLEWTGILSVVEKQKYVRGVRERLLESKESQGEPVADGRTDVRTVVSFHSHLGEKKTSSTKAQDVDGSNSTASSSDEEVDSPKKGFFSTWSTISIQHSLELIGAQRTKGHVAKSKEGMIVVLERLRKGGILGVVEGMKRDSGIAFGRDAPWKRVWQNGVVNPKDESARNEDES